MNKLTISNSLLQSFRDCPYKYYLEYIRRFTPLTTPAYFLWGSLVHLYSELLETMDEALIIPLIRKDIEKQIHSAEELEKLEGMLLLVPSVFDAHLLVYPEDKEQYEVFAVEEQFEIPLGDNAFFVGKIDKIVKKVSNGLYYLWETKTPAATGPSYWEALFLDTQIKGYHLGVTKGLNIEIQGCIFDIFKKPRQQQKYYAEETPDEWAYRLRTDYLIRRAKLFERRVHLFPASVMDNSYLKVLQLFVKELRFHQEEVIYPQYHPRTRKGQCVFMPLCEHGEESFAAKYFYIRSAKSFHPELKQKGVTNVS